MNPSLVINVGSKQGVILYTRSKDNQQETKAEITLKNLLFKKVCLNKGQGVLPQGAGNTTK